VETNLEKLAAVILHEYPANIMTAWRKPPPASYLLANVNPSSLMGWWYIRDELK
jgi:hypothetical protein